MGNEFFEEFKLLFNSGLESFEAINPKNLFVFNLMCGCERSNFGLFLNIEEAKLAGVPDKLLLQELFLRVNKHKRPYVPKSPKKIRDAQRKEKLWLMEYFKKLYHWSYQRIDEYWELLMMLSKEELARKFGLNNAERRKLGLKNMKVDVKKVKRLPVGQMKLVL